MTDATRLQERVQHKPMTARAFFLNKKWLWRTSVLVLLLFFIKTLDVLYPLPATVLSGAPAPGTLVVLARDGTPLRTWASTDGALRQPTTVEAVAPEYLQALQAYEDRWFEWHWGINPVALVRALGQWAWHGRIVSGSSTLTMQVARILALNDPNQGVQDRGLRTKLRQMGRALQLEWHLSKRDILQLYLNNAPMGGQVQGVEMAARTYLGKSAQTLSHAEAALLVALPQSPSKLRPDRAPARAQTARDKVLQRMADLGVWPVDTVADARLETVFAPPAKARWLAPLAAQRLKSSQPKGAQATATGLIHSTLDAGLQLRLEQLLLDRLNRLPPAVSMAALVVDNATLEVRGYAGSADFTDDSRAAHVDMVRGVRSPGSTLKPFLYAMALDEGLIHSESLLVDAPQQFGDYAPGNFQAAFAGPISVSDALQRSLNVPAVDLLDRVGPTRFAAHLRNAGLKLRMPRGATPNLSLILGGGGTTLEELVGAYTALARGGLAGLPRLTPQSPVFEARLMSEGAAFIVREILENGGRPGAPFRETTRRVAWKTGTSFGFRDAWAVGVTDRYTLGVWVGRPDGTPNPGHFGANTAAPLVQDLLVALDLGPAQTRQPPASVGVQDICWPLGLAAESTPEAHCRLRRTAWVLDHTTPPTLPDRLDPHTPLLTQAWVREAANRNAGHRLSGHRTPRLHTGARPPPQPHGGRAGPPPSRAPTAHRLAPGCLPPPAQAHRYTAQPHVRWPTAVLPWVTVEQRDPVEQLPLVTDCHGAQPRAALRILGLDHGSTLRATAPTQTLAKPQVRLRVQVVGTQAPVHWLLNGRSMPTRPNQPHQLQLSLTEAGDHTLTALTDAGAYAQTRFTVVMGRE